MLLRFSLLPLFLTLHSAASAQPVLHQPVACTIGSDCFIQYYVDRDPTVAVQDYSCGDQSYDGHKGVDYALLSLAQMNQGTAVLAAADGTIRGTRDQMPDILYSDANAEQVAGRECGNGVSIDHGDGWVTQYCHMKRGSIQVRAGQKVQAGTPLGQIGLSGKTQFPHLHMSLRHNGNVMDPFHLDATCDATTKRALWANPLPYQPGGLITIGFSDQIPKYQSIKDGDAAMHSLPADAPALVIWSYAYGTRQGDILRLRLTGPGGTVVDQDITLEKDQSQMFRASGRKRPASGWAAGTYAASAMLMRDGVTLSDHRKTLIMK